MKTLAIIQARHDSTRFPNKVDQIIGDHTMWYQVYRRVQMALPNTVMAWDCDYPEIDSNDVLQRYWVVASQQTPDVVVRITADCPLIEPAHILWMLGLYAQTMKPTFTSPEWDGFDVEIMSWKDLLKIRPRDAEDREHVTKWVRECADPVIISLNPPIRWSVNTPDDLAFVRKVYSLCPHCAEGTTHHTNASNSIGGYDRHPVWDLHQVKDGGLTECLAFNVLRGRMG